MRSDIRDTFPLVIYCGGVTYDIGQQSQGGNLFRGSWVVGRDSLENPHTFVGASRCHAVSCESSELRWPLAPSFQWTGDFLNLSAEHPARRTKTMMPFASLIFSSFWCSISATRTGCFLLLFSSLFVLVLLSYDVPIGDSLCDHSDLRSAIPELPFREPPI